MKQIKIILAGFLLLSVQNLYTQGVSYNQEFKVNNIYKVDIYIRPSVSYLADSGFVVCYEGFSTNGASINYEGICGQIFNNDGSKRGTEFQVTTKKFETKQYPSIGYLADGGFVVCWETFGHDGSDWRRGVCGQLFNSDGSKRGPEFQVNTNSYWYPSPSVSHLADGGFVVCWVSIGQDLFESKISGQLFNNDGSKRGNEFQVNTYIDDSQIFPCVSCLADSGFVVCWYGMGQDGIWNDVYCQLFNSDGSRRGTEFQVNTYLPDYQMYPSVSYIADGGFVVCWESYGQDGDGYGIYCQLFKSDGSRWGTEVQVSTYTANEQMYPNVSYLEDGGFVVCWESNGQDTSGYGIYCQLFKSDGSRWGTEVQVKSYTTFRTNFPGESVSHLGDSGFVVCWKSDSKTRGDYRDDGIYGKYYLLKEINHLLKPFALISPVYDTTLETTKPLFCWHHASDLRVNLPWEMEYLLYLDDNENFSSPFIFSAGSDTTCTIGALKPGTTYFWKVLTKNLNGDSLWSSETNGFFVSHDAPSGVEEIILENPQGFRLFANFPNPFNPTTHIQYTLPENKTLYHTTIKIFDTMGRLVKVLENSKKNPGIYIISWDSRDEQGNFMPSGVYIYSIQAGNYRATRKMLLLR